MFILDLASFLSNKTLNPLAIIPKNDIQMTKLDSISCGFWNRFTASIINKTATIISAILGGILLTFYSHGVLSLVGRV